MQMNFNTKLIAKHYAYFSTIDSTNSFLKHNLNHLPDGFLVFSTNQQQGYGSKNRTWLNFKNQNLAISILLKNINNHMLNFSTQMTAVALIQTLKQLKIKTAKIKWFNDILINNKKVAGILGESVILGDQVNLILGIGINLLQTTAQFKNENLNFAGSLLSQTKKKVTPTQFLIPFINTFEKLFLNFNNLEIHSLYCKNCQTIGKKIKIKQLNSNIFFFAKAANVLQSGELSISTSNSLSKINPSQYSICEIN